MGATDWITAVGTAGSAMAAVYYGSIRPELRRPRLTFGTWESVEAETTYDKWSGPAKWLRVVVSSQDGRDSAVGVVARVAEVRVTEADGPKDRQLGGFALSWTEFSTADAYLAPGAIAHLNVGYTLPAEVLGKPTFCLALVQVPFGARHQWTESTAEVTIVITSFNGRPVRHTFSIRLCPES